MERQIKADAARDAAKLLNEVWTLGIPVDPAAVARSAGLRVLEAPSLGENVLGALVKDSNRDPVIILNESDGPNRKRLTCAHEVGHFVRRRDVVEPFTRIDFRGQQSRPGADPDEIYASEFAACLLMPEDHVRRLAKDQLGGVELAIRFGVPHEALQKRLETLA
jgi:Zn-dependent peptidase ImmA (M78 family)